jgi:predicted MFS family arabinose efflux permease
MLRLIPASIGNGGVDGPPIFKLALGQLVSWGTLYYGITFLAQPISEDTGWSLSSIFGAFSAGLLIAALAAAPVGRMLDRLGSRATMTAGSVVAITAFVVIATSRGLPQFYAGWLIAGLSMAMTLYEAAFSAVRQYNRSDFRRSIGIITLIAGLASTAFWPLTHVLAGNVGWRTTLVVFAGLHLLVCAPVHFRLASRRGDERKTTNESESAKSRQSVGPAIWLAVSFGLAAIATSVISAQAAVMLAQLHVPTWEAMLALSLIGPMQVAGRMVELAASRRTSVTTTGQIAFTCSVLSIVCLLSTGIRPGLVFGFALLYGAANGVTTLVRGAIPSELPGHLGYAQVLGAISVPALIARAAGPLASADALAQWGVDATLWMLIAASLLAGSAFWYASSSLRDRRPS